MKDYSLEALLSFCHVLGEEQSECNKVIWNRKSACKSLISLLPEDLQKDVRKVDPYDAMLAYMRHKPSAADYTLREYKRRLKQTLEAFIARGDDSAVEDISTKEIGQIVRRSSSKQSATVSHSLRIALRSDFVAELCLPYDISADEATLLSKHLGLAAEATSMF